jgi:undecaprenyl-diphosphatase
MMREMTEAFIIAVIEGLTEFLPVSSTGHMILVGYFLDFVGKKETTYEIFIQLGAILAVVVLYHKRFVQLFDFSSNRGFSGIRGMTLMTLGILPIVIVGALFGSIAQANLFKPTPVAIALIVGGVLMIYFEKRFASLQSRGAVSDNVDQLSYLQAFTIGLIQCFAVWPGISRSGSTIVGGLAMGLRRDVAAEFSFLVAVPIMFAAVSHELFDNISRFEPSDVGIFGFGFFIAFLVALLAVRVFVGLLQRFTLVPFGVYRIIIGLIVLVVLGLEK